jgi:hypothetical protein
LPPPRSLIAAAEAPVHIRIHGDKAMADLTIESAGIAGRRIAVTVLDGQFAPLPAKEVTLLFAKPEAGIEPLRMPATQFSAPVDRGRPYLEIRRWRTGAGHGRRNHRRGLFTRAHLPVPIAPEFADRAI